MTQPKPPDPPEPGIAPELGSRPLDPGKCQLPATDPLVTFVSTAPPLAPSAPDEPKPNSAPLLSWNSRLSLPPMKLAPMNPPLLTTPPKLLRSRDAPRELAL